MTAVRRIKLGYNNVYALDTEGGNVLIDAGPDYAGAEGVLIADTPVAVVVTHGHLDHAGLGRWWQKRGASVSLGRGDEHLASTAQFGESAELEDFVSYVPQIGTPPDVAQGIIRGLEERREWAQAAARELAVHGAATPGGRWPTQLRFRHFVPDRLLGDGDLIAGSGLKVLACPGHTPGNLVLVHEVEGWLFSGDQLLPEITPTAGIQRRRAPHGDGEWRYRSLPRFLDSMVRLSTMHFSYCWPGHGEPFACVAETISENIAQIEQRSARMLELVTAGGSSSVYALAERTYPRALRRRFWQIISTVQGHLDILEERGLVRHTDGAYERSP
ncbi:MAG: MBL fold metallo-hydrolase [Tepidiformaceae bacterium]